MSKLNKYNFKSLEIKFVLLTNLDFLFSAQYMKWEKIL